MAEALPPIDTSVAIPPAVKAAAARAEAYYGPNPPEPAPTSPAIQITTQPPEPPAAEAAPAQTPEPGAPAPTPPPETAETAPHETQEVEQLRAQLAKQQRDYNALLGRNAQQRDYIAMQQNQLSQMANPRSWAQPRQALITDEERKAYGDEALSVMERKAREVVEPVVNQLNQKNQELHQELQRVKANDIYSVLDANLPNWREINATEDWLAWLNLPDIYSGVVRQQLLNEAFSAGDAGRILAFFRGFFAENPGHMDPQASEPTAAPPSPTTPVRKAAVKLESLAAPGRASPSPERSATAAKPVITNKDVSQFYWQVTHGQWNGRDAERAAREAEIHAAVNEGRVRIVK